MGTGPRLGAGRIHLLWAPSSYEERMLKKRKWDKPTMFLLTLIFEEGTVGSQVGCIVGIILLGGPNTCDSSLGCQCSKGRAAAISHFAAEATKLRASDLFPMGSG